MNLKRRVVTGLFFFVALAVLPASASALSFPPSSAKQLTVGTPSNDRVNGFASGDFNGDGSNDIAAVDDTSAIHVFLNKDDGTGSFNAPVAVGTSGSEGHPRIFAGKFGGDESTDLLVSVYGGSGLTFETYLGNGDGTFPAAPSATSTLPGGGTPTSLLGDFDSISTGDVNDDGYLDVVAGLSHALSVGLGSSTGALTIPSGAPFAIPTPDNDPNDLVLTTGIGDYNGDGDQDVAMAVQLASIGPARNIYVANGAGDGTFAAVADNPVFTVGSGTLAGASSVDLNGDSADDLSILRRGMFVSVYTMLGSPTGLVNNPDPAGRFSFGTIPARQDVADFDGDGDDDIAVSLQNADVGILLTSGDGTLIEDSGSRFSIPAIDDKFFYTLSLPGSFEATDFNGDNFPDVAGSSSDSNELIARGIETLTNSARPTVSPSSIDFTDTASGQTSTPVDVTITNTGAPPLPISQIAFTGTNPGQFAIDTSDCPATLGYNDFCDVAVTFEPNANGDFTASLGITFGSGFGTSTVSLTGGTGPVAAYTVDPTGYNYGNVIAGYEPDFRTNTFTITSTGDIPLELGTPALGASGASDYDILNPTACDTPLATGQSCTIDVKFRPPGGSSGGRTAVFGFVNSNAPFVPVVLQGTARRAEFSVTPASKDFGAHEIGTDIARPSQVFTVAASSGGAVPFNGASVTGPDAGSFKVVRSLCGPTIAPGASCGVEVEFNPETGSPGERKATLVIDAFSSTTPGPKSIPLSGTATGPAPPEKGDFKLKLASPKSVKRGKTLVIKAKVTNRGRTTAKPVKVTPSVPKKLAKKPRAITIPSLAMDRSVTKKIRVKVKKNAKKGRKLKVKVTVSASGFEKKTVIRVVKIK